MAYSVVRGDCIVTVPLAKHQLIGFKSIAETVFTAQYEPNLLKQSALTFVFKGLVL
jgi:hypothetical protein